MNGAVPPLPYRLSRSEQRKTLLTFRANRNPSQQPGYGLDNLDIDSWQGREIFHFLQCVNIGPRVSLSCYSIDKRPLIKAAE